MNYLDELKKLGQLKKDGKLTEEEFQKKKEEILSQSSKTKENKADSALDREFEKQGIGGKIKNASPATRAKFMSGELVDEYEIERKNKKENEEKRKWNLVKSQVVKLLKSNKGILFSLEEILSDLKKSGFDTSRLKITNRDWEEWNLKCYLNDFGKESKILTTVPSEHQLDDQKCFYIGEKERIDREKKEKQKEERRVKNLKSSIIKLLKEQGTKIPASDIDAHLKNKNVDEIKEFCEKMYHDGEISRTSNYRYFVLTKKKPKPTQSKQVDIGKELKKYKDLLDQELITQDDYDAKKKELLGL